MNYKAINIWEYIFHSLIVPHYLITSQQESCSCRTIEWYQRTQMVQQHLRHPFLQKMYSNVLYLIAKQTFGIICVYT